MSGRAMVRYPMFIECPECHHPYDISSYRAGERLRCRCGQIIVVPKEGLTARQVRMLHCGHCGGELEHERSNCPYCGSLVDLSSARCNAYCPHCLAASPDGASYCCGCGEPLIEILEPPTSTSHQCPRCAVRMRRRALGARHPLECPVCSGIFLDGDDFTELFADQESRNLATEVVLGPRKSLLKFEEPRYVPCPFCGNIMNRVNYDSRSGVIIDYCVEHGYWFDAGELEKIATWVSSGGQIVKYAADSEDKREGRHRFTSSREAAQQPSELEIAKERQREIERERRERELEGASLLDIFISSLIGK